MSTTKIALLVGGGLVALWFFTRGPGHGIVSGMSIGGAQKIPRVQQPNGATNYWDVAVAAIPGLTHGIESLWGGGSQDVATSSSWDLADMGDETSDLLSSLWG